MGIMFGYASDETADCMPLTHSMATRLGKVLTEVRKSGELWWLRPDGKTQVTIEYLQREDGSVEPRKIHTVVISTQHAEPLKATRRKEVAGYTGPDATAPSMEEMNKLIVEEVVKKTLQEIKLKNGDAAITFFGDHTHLHINPSGKFIIGGPRETLDLRAVRLSIHMAVGELTEEVPSLGRIRPRLTVLQPTSAARWRSPSSRVDCANELLYNCRTQLVLLSLCLCSWKPMVPSRARLQPTTLQTSSRLSLIAVLEQSPFRLRFVSLSIKRPPRIATSAASQSRRMVSNSLSGKTRRIAPSTKT